MRQGVETIKRMHARNFVQTSSQKRLDEVVPAYNNQITNSLAVDCVEIQYYNALHSGLPCSCEQQDSVIDFDDNDEVEALVQYVQESSISRDIVVHKQAGSTFGDADHIEVFDAGNANSLFGDNGANIDSDDDYDTNVAQGSDDYAPIEEEIEVYSGDNSLFAGHNVNCGLCYRTGFIPSHGLQHGIRIVLTHHHVTDTLGYFLNNAEYPFRFERLGEQDSFVEFVVAVPKYHSKAVFSIRNGCNVLNDNLYTEDYSVLNQEYIRRNAGKTVTIRVCSNCFTHVSIEFHNHAEPIRANIPNVAKNLDYTMLETIGNLQVILPPNIGSVGAMDLIAIPSRNLYLKVVDITHVTTAKMRHLEWQATCRVLQPQESLRKLFFNHSFSCY
jgi:hypothetical protein